MADLASAAAAAAAAAADASPATSGQLGAPRKNKDSLVPSEDLRAE